MIIKGKGNAITSQQDDLSSNIVAPAADNHLNPVSSGINAETSQAKKINKRFADYDQYDLQSDSADAEREARIFNWFKKLIG